MIVANCALVLNCTRLHLNSLRSPYLDFHLLPKREDSYPAYQGYGEIENDLHRNDDDMIVVEVVDVEEEDDEDADKIDGKVERHPDKRGKDELVSGLADAKDQQTTCHNRDHRDEDVDAARLCRLSCQHPRHLPLRRLRLQQRSCHRHFGGDRSQSLHIPDMLDSCLLFLATGENPSRGSSTN